MLLPRFSIRTALGIVTGVAVVSLFAGQALGGRAWAFGLTIAVLSVPIALAVHAAFFVLGMALANLLGSEDVIAHTSRGGVERSGRSAPRPVNAAESSPTSEPTPAAP